MTKRRHTKGREVKLFLTGGTHTHTSVQTVSLLIFRSPLYILYLQVHHVQASKIISLKTSMVEQGLAIVDRNARLNKSFVHA